MPGFAQMIAFYFLSPRLLRSVPYGTKVGASVLPASGPQYTCILCMLRLEQGNMCL
jgi:hypothetical protein